jgi:O-methyltransferase
MIPFVLRLPGLRRYGVQLARLEERLQTANERLALLKKQAKEQHDYSQHQIAELVRALARQRPHVESTDEVATQEKKLDLREIEGFAPIAWRIREDNRTFLNFDRLYTLWQAITAVPSEATALAEVGAYRGGSARFVAEAMRSIGRELPFYVCDTFRGHVDVDKSVDGLHETATQFVATDVDRVSRYLRMFENVTVVEGDIRETAPRFADQHKFGFVHVDVDVYPITRFCLECFGPRLACGGTIVVDDYGFTTCAGVKKAVDEFVSSRPEYRMLHLLTGQAVMIRIED